MIRTFKSKINYSNSSTNVDPILVEIIRNSLNSAAEQMKRSLISQALSGLLIIPAAILGLAGMLVLLTLFFLLGLHLA